MLDFYHSAYPDDINVSSDLLYKMLFPESSILDTGLSHAEKYGGCLRIYQIKEYTK